MIYEARNESLFEENPLPPFMIDPDSTFSAYWDLTSVIMLLYVTVTVPLRVCFGVDIDMWSFAFFVELLVDLFFVMDVGLNFRTAYRDENGFRENRPRQIAKHYMARWFWIDLLSCLPFGYVQYIVDGGEGPGSELKGVKAIRLMKITKMMRLARLKRIIMRHSEDGAGLGGFQQWQSVIFTLLTILFLAHMLSCFFYMVGEGSEQLGPHCCAFSKEFRSRKW